MRRRALTMKRSQSATALSMQRPVATAAASAAIAESITVQPPAAVASMAVSESVVMPDVELGSGQLRKTMSSQQLVTVDIASSLPFTPITLVFKDIRCVCYIEHSRSGTCFSLLVSVASNCLNINTTPPPPHTHTHTYAPHLWPAQVLCA